MSEDRPDMELDSDVDSLPIIRNLMRPSYRWIVTLGDVAMEGEDTTESDPTSLVTESECVVVPL